MVNVKNIWILTAANFRKNKSQTISLLAFVLLAAMFLNIGLYMYFGMDKFFDERARQLNAPHFWTVESEDDLLSEKMSFIENYPGVTETEKQDVISGRGEYFIGENKNLGQFVLSRPDINQKMNPVSPIGESLPLTGDAIYIPYFMLLDGGYNIGDEFKMNFMGTEFVFQIAGGTEEIMYGALMANTWRFYISGEKYEEFEQRFFDSRYILLSARMEKGGDGLFLRIDFGKKYVLGENFVSLMCYDDAKSSRTFIAMIVAIVITAFSIILLAVSLIIIRFRINNNIEESMTNIGVQKAVGYRSGQIVSSVAAQFGLTAFAGGIIGIVLAWITMPLITAITEPQIGLIWNPGFDALSAFAALAFVLLTATAISFISARRINKLHPLVALRGGLTTHNFKKNALPLDKSRGALTLLLALKQLLQNKKQAVAVCVIVAAVTFASVAGLAMHYNLNVNIDNFARIIAGEMPDAIFSLKNKNDVGAFKENMLERPEVRKAFGYVAGSVSLSVEGTDLAVVAVEDTSLLEGAMLVRGRYPRHNNEIALGNPAAKVTGKNIGDTVKIKSGENEKDYLVTGIIQVMNYGGLNVMISGSGILEVQPDFQFDFINVYLTDTTDAKSFVENVAAAEDDIFDSAVAIKDLMDSQLGGIGDAFVGVTYGIVAVTAIIVVLVLYMVIKTAILRRKREIGIQKAVGFTTFQLMNQIALNMTPIIFGGVMLGAFGGYFGLNPLFIALMSGQGVVQADLPAPLGWTVMVCVGLIVLAYAVSMLIAWRIRKISAYSLIVE